jgi:chemotaxis protein MotB
MAKKKKKEGGGGAPDWMVTYGDMMTLLLCFFVLIVSFSTIDPKEKHKYEAAMESIKEALGMPGNGKVPNDAIPKMSMVQVLERVQRERKKHDNEASTKEEGMQGETTEVTKIRDGMQFTVGGPVSFEPASATLTDQAKQRLETIAELMRGYNNLIQLRGHAASMELAGHPDSSYQTLWQLSHARARAVMDYLTEPPIGLRPDRFRLVAVADREPLAQRAYSSRDKAPNRRVEVVVAEQLTREVKGSGSSSR